MTEKLNENFANRVAGGPININRIGIKWPTKTLPNDYLINLVDLIVLAHKPGVNIIVEQVGSVTRTRQARNAGSQALTHPAKARLQS